MKKISTNLVSRLRLGAPILAATMLAAISLPSSSVYAAPAVTDVINLPGFFPTGLVVAHDADVLYGVMENAAGNSFLLVVNTQFNSVTAITGLFKFPTAVRSFEPVQIVENPAEQLVFVLNFGTPSIDVINEATNAQIASFQAPNVGPDPIGFAVTPDGKELWVANSGPGFNNGTVQVVDSDPTSANFGQAIALINVGGNPNTIVFNSTGTLAYVLNGGGPGWVDEISVATHDTKKSNIGLALGNINFANPLAMAIAKGNKSLFIANGTATLLQMNVPSGVVPNITQMFTTDNPGLGRQQQGQVLRSPSGKTVYVAATGDDSVRFADVATAISGAPIFLPVVGGIPSRPYFMALAPNGRTLYVSNFNAPGFTGPLGGLQSISVITGLTP